MSCSISGGGDGVCRRHHVPRGAAIIEELEKLAKETEFGKVSERARFAYTQVWP